MLFFATLGYFVLVVLAMLLAPRAAFVAGAIALPFGMGWVTWPIADMPAFWLGHALGFAAGGLAALLDGKYWYDMYRGRQAIVLEDEELDDEPEAADARA